MNGRVFQLEWAASVCDVQDFLNAEVFAAAARHGDIGVFEWLRAHGCPWDARALEFAAAAQRWPCVVTALRHGCPIGNVPVPGICARMPLGEMKLAMQALYDGGRGELVTQPALFRAVMEKVNVPAAEWLICDLGEAVTADDCVGWGLHGCPLRYLTAMQGHPRLLQHMYEKGLYTPGPADVRVALGLDWYTNCAGRVEVLRWLLARGIRSEGPQLAFESDFRLEPYHPTVDSPEFCTFQAARLNSLELLQLLVEEGDAALGENACVVAAERGGMEVLRWLLGKGCHCGEATWCAAVRCGGERNDYRPLALLHSLKRPWSEAVWAAAAPYVEVQAWLMKRGCPGSRGAAGGAVAEAGAAAGPVALA
jgi:hypothetical protein